MSSVQEASKLGSEDKITRVTFTIHGDVQGVGFRDAAVRAARDIGAKGRIQNDASGKTVSGEIQGNDVRFAFVSASHVAAAKSFVTALCTTMTTSDRDL